MGQDNTTPRLAQGREHVVATVDEIPHGSHKLVPIGRHGVGVYNVNGTFYAIANYCPHEGGPLCSGRARGLNIVDGAARLCDPVIQTINGNPPIWGKFLKDYFSTTW